MQPQIVEQRGSRLLAGIRVIELGIWVAAPAAAGILADWGADVVKIEPPGGDPFRQIFSRFAGLKAPGSPPFDLDNRGKRSVILNLKQRVERQALERLIARADVFVTNHRPAVLERLDLTANALVARHPRLVACAISGYGTAGCEANRPAFDVGAFWARSGVASSMTPPGTTPPLMRGGFGDHVTALAAASGICAGLFARERTGRGQVVSTSLLRTGLYSIGWDTAVQLYYGKLAPAGSRQEAMNPLINPYKAKDGRWFWLIGLEADRHWPATARAAGHRQWLTDPRFATATDRRHNSRDLISLLDKVFASKPLADWTVIFDREGVWWAPVQQTSEVVTDPQVAAAGGLVEIPPSEDRAAIRSVATPVDFGSGTAAPAGPVPRPGEHTEELLREAGLSERLIAQLVGSAK